jgi:hypothetical protein
VSTKNERLSAVASLNRNLDYLIPHHPLKMGCLRVNTYRVINFLIMCVVGIIWFITHIPAGTRFFIAVMSHPRIEFGFRKQGIPYNTHVQLFRAIHDDRYRPWEAKKVVKYELKADGEHCEGILRSLEDLKALAARFYDCKIKDFKWMLLMDVVVTETFRVTYTPRVSDAHAHARALSRGGKREDEGIEMDVLDGRARHTVAVTGMGRHGDAHREEDDDSGWF